MDNAQIRNDAIDALISLGHTASDARRLVDAAIQRQPDVASANELVVAAYKRPSRLEPIKTQAVASPVASAYYAYYSGASVSGETAELVQIAKAVGPGLSISEFEDLAKHVESVQSHKGSMLKSDYQNALWAIPEAFNANRKAPVHFRPLRDRQGRPLDHVIDPIPSEPIQSIAPPPPIEPVPREAMESLAGGSSAPPPPEPITPRQSPSSRPPEPITAPDVGQAAPQAIIDQAPTAMPARPPVSPEALAAVISKPRPLGIGDTVMAPNRQGQSVPGVIEWQHGEKIFVSTADSGRDKSISTTIGQVAPYSPAIADGMQVQLPGYDDGVGGMATVVQRNDSGTYLVNINGRMMELPASGMRQPDGSIIPSAPPPEPASVRTAITGALDQPEPQQSTSGNSLDQMQAAADMIGIVDQTGITDLANAGVSITRAISEPERAGEHLVNAGISAVSAIPIVGDLAKLLKRGGRIPQPPGPRMRNLAGAPPRQNFGPMPSGGGVDSIAQSALTFLGMGGSGSGGNQPPAPPGSGGPGGTGGNPESLSGRAEQVGSSLGSLGDSIQSFLNNTGAAGAVLATVGAEVYNRALKPLIDWFKQIDETSRKMLDDNRRLAEFNGGMAAAYQQLDVGRFLRDQDQAGAMAGSIGRLSGAQNRFEEAQQDLFQPYEKLSADIQAARTEIAAYLVKMIDLIDFIGNILDWYYQQDNKNPTAARSSAERAFQMLDEIVVPRKVGPNK